MIKYENYPNAAKRVYGNLWQLEKRNLEKNPCPIEYKEHYMYIEKLHQK